MSIIVAKDEKKERLFNLVTKHSDTLCGVLGEIHGLSEWFRAYVGGEFFESLTPVQKSNAFDDFDKLRKFISGVNDLGVEQVY